MEKDKCTYKIRFNTNSKLEQNRWRIIDSEDKEILVKDIRISVPCYTSVDWCEDIKDYKYHITTTGKLTFVDDIAVISVN
jgi:hypothetical protein